MDEIDAAQLINEQHQAFSEAEARRQAAAIPKGAPGECVECGAYMGRLVEGVCAPCRDRAQGVYRK